MFKKLFTVSDQLLLTFWSMLLTLIFANVLSNEHFVNFNIYYVVQTICLLFVNSTIGQLLLISGRNFSFISILRQTSILSFSSFLLVFLTLISNVLKVDNIDFIEKILFSCSVGLFCFFELLRRYIYSLNEYRLALKGVLIITIGLFIQFILLYIFKRLDFNTFLIANTFIYVIAISYTLVKLRSMYREIGKEFLSFSKMFRFSKWLFVGIVAYIISDKLFIFYLNSIDAHDELIALRLTETIFGIALVFIAAFENYFISQIPRDSKLVIVLKSLFKIWSLFVIILILITPFFNFMLKFLFNYHTTINYSLLIIILIAYEIMAVSRAFVVYLRVNTYNKVIFFSNLITASIVVVVFLLKIELDLYRIFLLKSIFAIVNIFVYLIPYLKYEKNFFNFPRIRS